jgi:hypothetical protein
MADTQRDGRDGRTNGGSADRPDRGRRSGCRPGCRSGWRARRDGGQEPQRPRLFGPWFWLLLLGLLDDLPFRRRATGPARCGRLQAPRGALWLSENGSVKPSFVMRPLAMVVTSLRPDGWKRLTARHGSRSRQRGGLTSGRSALSSTFDRASTQSDQIELAKSLASGGRRRSALQQARGWTRPELLVWGGAPRRNRTGDPILTIDGRPLRETTRHLAPPHSTTRGWPHRR